MAASQNFLIRDGTKQMNKLSEPGLEKRAFRTLSGLTEIPIDFIHHNTFSFIKTFLLCQIQCTIKINRLG
jgi:hypothetical protein